MGKLTDTEFWAGTLNEMAALAPPLGQAIEQRNAAKIREIACRALSALLDDPEFSQDLANAIAQAQAVPDLSTMEPSAFAAFLNRFMELENKLLKDAGVDTVASRDLEREIRTLGKTSFAENLDRLSDKIEFLRRLACSPDAVDDPKNPLWQVAWRGVKGVGVIGLDMGSAAGAAIVLTPAGGAAAGVVAGISASYGAALINEAVRGRW